MREIKFRGKAIPNDKWVYGYYYEWASRTFIHLTEEAQEGFSSEIYQVHPQTISQYSGLKDKNGREIFEGDVVAIGEEGTKRYNIPIEFKNGSFGLNPVWTRNKKDFIELSAYINDVMRTVVEVIGNIHEIEDLINK